MVRSPPMLTRGERGKDELLITVDGSTLHCAMVTGDAEPLADGTGVGAWRFRRSRFARPSCRRWALPPVLSPISPNAELRGSRLNSRL